MHKVIEVVKVGKCLIRMHIVYKNQDNWDIDEVYCVYWNSQIKAELDTIVPAELFQHLQECSPIDFVDIAACAVERDIKNRLGL